MILDWAGTQVYAQGSSSPVFEQVLSVVDATFDLDVSGPGAAFNTTSARRCEMMRSIGAEHVSASDNKVAG